MDAGPAPPDESDFPKWLVVGLYLLAGLTVWGVPAGTLILVSLPVCLTIGWFSGGIGTQKPTPNPKLRTSTRTLLILGIFVLGMVLRVYHLDRFGFRLDELYQYESALGFLRTGEFSRWDLVRKTLGSSYERAWLYTGQVALAFQGFGTSLAVGRWVSLLWGVLLLVPLGMVGRQLGLSPLGRLSILSLALISPYFVTASRWLRMYTMFTTAYLSFLVATWYAINVNTVQWRIRWGILALMLGALSFHLHPLFLVSLPGIVLAGLFRARGWIREHASDGVVVLGGGVLLTVSVILGWELSEVFFREIALLSHPRWIYVLYPFQEYLGYSLGGLVFAALLLFLGNRPVEQYYLLVFLSSVLILVFCTRRFPQYRYAGHLIALGYPLGVLTLRRLGSRLSEKSRSRLPVFLVVLVLVIPLLQLPGRARYIWAGNYGWVGFPGTKSPRYEDLVQYVNKRSRPGDFVGAFLIYDVYRDKMRREGVVVKNLMQVVRNGTVVEEIKRLSSTYRRIWLLVPTHLRRSLPPEFSNLLERSFEQPVSSKQFNVAVYTRGEPLGSLGSDAPPNEQNEQEETSQSRSGNPL